MIMGILFSRKVRHYVAIRNPASDNTQIVEKYKDSEGRLHVIEHK